VNDYTTYNFAANEMILVALLLGDWKIFAIFKSEKCCHVLE